MPFGILETTSRLRRTPPPTAWQEEIALAIVKRQPNSPLVFRRKGGGEVVS